MKGSYATREVLGFLASTLQTQAGKKRVDDKQTFKFYFYLCVHACVLPYTERPEADFRSLGVEVTGMCKGVEIWSSNRIVSAQ